MSHHYIPLNRTFFDFSENQNIEDAAMRSDLAKHLNNVLDWDKLLQSHCIVILGEPGSGKTWEMENQVKVRSNAGNYAFFLRLEQLLVPIVPLSTLFSPSDQQKYRSWQKDVQQEAIFFLDAKDEAALKTAYALRDALTNFVKHLGHSNLRQSRAKVVISCRVSEWYPYSDQDDIRRCFDLAEEKKESQRTSQSKQVPDLRIVQLAPLDRAQVKILATAWGITQPDEFLQTVDTRYAWGLMGRPLDVKSIVNYWKQHGTLSTLRELIEDDITHKLKQHGDIHKKEDTLSAFEARQAVEALAAATLFCKQFTFVLPESDGHAQGISPKAIFSDWDDKKIGYVLNRPLFDEAIYGHVRFHHRQTAEYLAASWLQKRLEYGCPLTEIEPLLFVDRYGQTVVPPSRAPALAWLAVMGNEIWNWRIRQSLLQNHPEILLRYGDPQSLTIEDKRVLLTRLMEKYTHQQRVFLETDAEKLALFGAPELAEDLKQHLRNKSLSNDLRELLLRIIFANLGRR